LIRYIPETKLNKKRRIPFRFIPTVVFISLRPVRPIRSATTDKLILPGTKNISNIIPDKVVRIVYTFASRKTNNNTYKYIIEIIMRS
jgi:hypothetical protein